MKREKTMTTHIARIGAITALVIAAAAGLTACSAATPTPAPTTSPSSSASPSSSPSAVPCNPDQPWFGETQPTYIDIPIPPNPAELYTLGLGPVVANLNVPAGTSGQWTAEITSVDKGDGFFDPCASVYFTPGSGGDTAIAPQLIPKGIGLNQVVLTNSVSGESYTFKVDSNFKDAD